jgi:hypothetical protein
MPLRPERRAITIRVPTRHRTCSGTLLNAWNDLNAWNIPNVLNNVYTSCPLNTQGELP